MLRGRACSLLLFCAAWKITDENDNDDAACSVNAAHECLHHVVNATPQVASAFHFAGKDMEAVNEAVRG